MPAASRPLSAALGALSGGMLTGIATADSQVHRATDAVWFAEPLVRAGFGLSLAVVVAALLARGGARRSAWLVVAAGAAALVPAAWLTGHGSADGAAAVALGSLAAGTVLGATVAAAWGEPPIQSALALGALAGGLTGQPWLRSTGTALAPIWLAVATVLAAIAGAVTAESAFRIPQPSPATMRLALAAAAGLTVLSWLYGAWSNAAGRPPTGALPTIALAGLTLVIGGTEVARRLAAPADQSFLPATLAVAAGAAPVLASLATPQEGIAAEWLIATGFVAVAIGLRVAIIRPLLPVGLTLLALVPLIGVLLPDAGQDGPLLAVRVAAVGLGAGLIVASTFPGQAPIAALGFAGAATVATLCVIAFDAGGAAAWAPLTRADSGSPGLTEWLLQPEPDRTAALAMLLTVGYAAAAILWHPRRARMRGRSAG